MNHQGTKGTKNSESQRILSLLRRQRSFGPYQKKFSSSAFLGALGALVVNFAPVLVEACPRCFDATPYRTGLLWAVALLMPVPFILAGLLIRWIVRNSKGDFPPY